MCFVKIMHDQIMQFLSCKLLIHPLVILVFEKKASLFHGEGKRLVQDGIMSRRWEPPRSTHLMMSCPLLRNVGHHLRNLAPQCQEQEG